MKSKRSFSLTLAALEGSLDNVTKILFQFMLVNVMLVSTPLFCCFVLWCSMKVQHSYWNEILDRSCPLLIIL